MRALRRAGVRSRVIHEIFTCCAFWIAVSALPVFVISYIVVRISKHLWLKLLSSRYPGLEFIRTDTVRSLLDTHRNQGIINVLLCIKGTFNADEIKQQLVDHVIERRDRNGQLMFPRLRQCLVSCWGNYAWDANIVFRLESHFLVTNGVHRGRPVAESNIQDYVSEIVSKYFPSEQPPWQYIIIPCVSIEPKYFILVRVHHLLLTGSNSINIGDLLLLKQQKQNMVSSPIRETAQESPLTKLFPMPTAIPELLQKLSESLSNAWNEFISEYDPVESPHALKTLPGVFHVAGLFLVSGVSALRNLSKKSNVRDFRSESPVTAANLVAAIQEECKRRNLTIPKILISPLVTVDPRKWPRQTFRTTMIMMKEFVKFPLRFRDELLALYELKTSNRASYSHTLTWKYSGLAQLWLPAIKELLHGIVEIYRAPGNLWTDTIGPDAGQRHLLQTASLCGRKVTAWSRPVSRSGVERAARSLGVSATDVTLYAATEALRAFFEQTQNSSPEIVLTTARAASEDFLFTFAEGDGKMFKKSQTGGMVCLSLPIGGSPRRIASVIEQACGRQCALTAAWAAQARCGALTRAVPSPIARLALNLLSRRYAVSFAEINAPVDAKTRSTLWEHTVDSVIYWRPPQANISMSLTVIQYGDSIRLAVMTDARLSPAHNIPATRWPNAVEQLVSKVDQGLARIASQSQQSMENLPETSQSGHLSIDTQQLRPPSSVSVSPPPMRRRITHH